MPRPRKLTDEEIAAAQVMWLAKVRRKIIAARFDIGLRTLYEAMERFNKKRAEMESARFSDSSPRRKKALIAGQST